MDRSLISPIDESNVALLSNVRPSSRPNPEPRGTYNLVVLGAGTAGLVSAVGAASLGAKVALIERAYMGGDCLNFGCVPSKSLIRAGRLAYQLKSDPLLRAQRPFPALDFELMMRSMRRARMSLSFKDSVERMEKLGIDVFLGHARFAGSSSVEVDGKALTFKKAVIATGSKPLGLELPGVSRDDYLTNEDVFELDRLPGRLLVVGGGPLGCELGQLFAHLGSEVTMVEKHSHFLPKEEREAAEILAASFERDGIRLLLNSDVSRLGRRGPAFEVIICTEGQETALEVDRVLVAAGRAPAVDGLDLEKAGVAYDKMKGILVNDFLQTTNPLIYAAGDACLEAKFTHMADASARIVVQNALFLGRKRLSSLIVPWCTYTTPEVAHVGLYPRQAKERGIPVETISVPMSDVDRAVLDLNPQGFVKVHLREGTDRILGATVVGDCAGEIISEISLAMNAGLGLRKLGQVIHPYPTKAEAIKKAADECNRARLTPFWKKTASRWLDFVRG